VLALHFNPVIADGYAGKTGSDAAAAGCLAFLTRVRVSGHLLTAAGVVMGQGEGSNTKAILTAAREAAEQMVASVVPLNGARTTTASGAPGGQ
jgi:hypothetical protein